MRTPPHTYHLLLVALIATSGLFGLGACGPAPNADEPQLGARQASIIQGKPCGEKTAPSAVALILEGTMTLRSVDIPMRSIMCTGTLIAPDVILTAAHCATPSMMTAGMGTLSDPKYYVSFTADLQTFANPMRGLPPQMGGVPLADLPKDAIAVRAYLPHPDFDPQDLKTFKGGTQQNLHDLALMFLDVPVPLDAVRPAVLITQEEAPKNVVAYAPVHIVGWGQQFVTSNPLLPPPAGSVGVKICASSSINELGPHEMQIGSGPNTSRKCHGDSGGPTYLAIKTSHAVKERLIGITSHAYDDTDCAKGGVDTRVDAWLAWIDTQLKKRCTEGTRAWCEVQGIIPPPFYDPPPAPDGGTPDGSLSDGGSGHGGDGAMSPEATGCDCRVADDTPARAIPWLFALVLLGLRRRRRQA